MQHNKKIISERITLVLAIYNVSLEQLTKEIWTLYGETIDLKSEITSKSLEILCRYVRITSDFFEEEVDINIRFDKKNIIQITTTLPPVS
jgi:hypothetical protein